MSKEEEHHLTFTAEKRSDPVRFKEHCASGGRATQEYWRKPPPPAWLLDMDDKEFERYLERQGK